MPTNEEQQVKHIYCSICGQRFWSPPFVPFTQGMGALTEAEVRSMEQARIRCAKHTARCNACPPR